MTGEELRKCYPFCLLDDIDIRALQAARPGFNLDTLAEKLTLEQKEKKEQS